MRCQRSSFRHQISRAQVDMIPGHVTAWIRFHVDLTHSAQHYTCKIDSYCRERSLYNSVTNNAIFLYTTSHSLTYPPPSPDSISPSAFFCVPLVISSARAGGMLQISLSHSLRLECSSAGHTNNTWRGFSVL